MRRIWMVTALAVGATLGAACGAGGSKAATTATSSVSGSAQAIDTTYPSAALHSNRHVLVLLPPGYRSSRRYPAVEFLHGAPGGPAQMVAFLDMTALSNQSKTPFIAVAPDGNGP